MTVPSLPLKLSAESTIKTTAKLHWSPPVDDGGFLITGYFIERRLEGIVLSIAVVDGGSEYTVAPTVTITTITGEEGIGATATSTLTISGDSVDTIDVVLQGNGYTSAPIVTIDGPGTTATATADIGSGDSVVSIDVVNAGIGYPSVPDVTISSPETGTTATATANLSGSSVSSIDIIQPGDNYVSAPTVTIAPPGTTATATATISDDSFLTLEADTQTTDTTFDDETLFPRNNPTYRVSAINSNGTSPPSNLASTTTSTSEAQTIKELLFDNWSLTGELSKTKVNDMTEVVNFLDRDQVPGNKKAKMVTVQKINEIGNESVVEHPKFFEESDTFEITCFLQVPDSADDIFSIWIDLMQQMTSEVSRILKIQFSPSTDTGEFFRTNTGWTKDDTFFPDEPMLVRTLRFTLTRIVSTSKEVFLGYGGVLLFNASNSIGDSLPTSDYMYTQVERVEIVQGWRNLPYITTDSPKTTAIPIYYRGGFSGRFACTMQLKKSDITPTTLNSLAEIFLPQSNGELGTAVFFHITSNTQTDEDFAFLTESVPVNITNVEKITENEQLVEFSIRGNLTGPSSFFITGNMVFQNPDAMAYENDDDMTYGG